MMVFHRPSIYPMMAMLSICTTILPLMRHPLTSNTQHPFQTGAPETLTKVVCTHAKVAILSLADKIHYSMDTHNRCGATLSSFVMLIGLFKPCPVGLVTTLPHFSLGFSGVSRSNKNCTLLHITNQVQWHKKKNSVEMLLLCGNLTSVQLQTNRPIH